MELQSKNVEAIFMDCLCNSSQDDGIIAEGIVADYKFDINKIEMYKSEIELMLDELPNEFKSDGGGGGWSFLNACVDKNGNQWASFHKTIEQLFCLVIAIGKVKSLLPKELWSILPGNMPYYVIIK